jgi:hypothetical protein
MTENLFETALGIGVPWYVVATDFNASPNLSESFANVVLRNYWRREFPRKVPAKRLRFALELEQLVPPVNLRSAGLTFAVRRDTRSMLRRGLLPRSQPKAAVEVRQGLKGCRASFFTTAERVSASWLATKGGR